jgi:adhesin transport system membrane fusion protein
VVPDEPNLLMTVRVKPADIGFIHAGQKAHVRVLAYDAATYGKMDAQVVRVGADAVVDDRGESYFEVQLTAARDQLRLQGKPLPITPGMPVDVGILTGERSVMQYLLKPVLRGVQRALQER